MSRIARELNKSLLKFPHFLLKTDLQKKENINLPLSMQYRRQSVIYARERGGKSQTQRKEMKSLIVETTTLN